MLDLAVAVAISLLFRAECIKKPRRGLIKLFDKIIQIMGVLRLPTVYKAKRDLVVTEFEDIHGEGSFTSDVATM